MSVNAFNLYGDDDPAAWDRFARLEATVRRVDADVVAVQEIVAQAQPKVSGKRRAAARNTRRLAEAVGRCCEVDGGPIVAVGGGIHHTALLFRDGIEPVRGSVARFEREPHGLWHSLVTAVFDLGGPTVRVGSVHLSPFDPGRGWAWHDAGQVMRAMNSDAVAGLVGGDFNGIGASQVRLDDGWAYYDPDPYAGVDWHPDHAYQFDEHGRLDRSVAHRLEGPGRLRDCARVAGVPWMATTGRHPADRHPPRRVDRWYATHHFPDAAVSGFEVIAAEDCCTDHDPVVVRIDECALATRANQTTE